MLSWRLVSSQPGKLSIQISVKFWGYPWGIYEGDLPVRFMRNLYCIENTPTLYWLEAMWWTVARTDFGVW